MADTFCVLLKHADGAPFVDIQLMDFYNKLKENNKKSFDGSDANSLIEMFKKRFKNENDFYYDSEVDLNCCLLSFSGMTNRC